MSFDTDFDGGEDETTIENHERRIERCKGCHAKIIWFRTERLKMMPVDADTVEPDDTELDLSRHVSHFATCTKAKEFRKDR
jgi:hypothetical protein